MLINKEPCAVIQKQIIFGFFHGCIHSQMLPPYYQAELNQAQDVLDHLPNRLEGLQLSISLKIHHRLLANERRELGMHAHSLSVDPQQLLL